LGQGTAKTYFWRGEVHGPSYFVTVININSDSTYLRTDYGHGDRKSWRKYKEWEAETSTGKIKKWGNYYRMTEYRDNQPTHGEFKLKITKRKMIFWDVREEPSMRFKGMTLKRASL